MASSSSSASNAPDQYLEHHHPEQPYTISHAHPLQSTSISTSSICKNCQRSLLSKSLDGRAIINDQYCSSECYWSSTLDLEMPIQDSQYQARSSTLSYGVPLESSKATGTFTPTKMQPQQQQGGTFGNANAGRNWDRETAQNAMFDFHAYMSTTFRARTILV